jgi:hypothetical protein
LIAGLSKPEHGIVTVSGVDTRSRKIAELAHIVGITYQNPDEQISERSDAMKIKGVDLETKDPLRLLAAMPRLMIPALFTTYGGARQ